MAETTSVEEPVSTETKQESKYSPEAQKAIDELTKKLEKAEAERKKANEQDAEKRLKLKEIEEKKLQDEGKLSELVELRTKEREELSAKVKALESENETAKTKLTEIETARRNELLAKLPEGKRETYKNVDLGLLEQISKDLSVVVTGNSQGNERGAAAIAAAANGNTKVTPTVPFGGSNSDVIEGLIGVLSN